MVVAKSMIVTLLCLHYAASISLGDVNILVTTDMHGWVDSHVHPCAGYCTASLPAESNEALDANFGHLVDLYTHLRSEGATKGQDVFLVDNGDVVDGTGFSSGHPHGRYMFEILKKMPYAALNIGNHELYKNETVSNIAGDSGFAKSWNGSYLTTNVYLNTSNTRVQWDKLQTLGSKSLVVNGPQGAKLLFFGFMYEQTDTCEEIAIRPVADVCGSEWFIDTIRNATVAASQKAVHAIVILLHADLDSPHVKTILSAIRTIAPKVPVQFLTGHSHKRGQAQLDPWAGMSVHS